MENRKRRDTIFLTLYADVCGFLKGEQWRCIWDEVPNQSKCRAKTVVIWDDTNNNRFVYFQHLP